MPSGGAPDDGLQSDLKSGLRAVQLDDRRTSIRMEALLWQAFDGILDREQLSATAILTVLDKSRGDNSLTAALRVFITAYYFELSQIEGKVKSVTPILQQTRERNGRLREGQDSYVIIDETGGECGE